jgi:hypothetical protein
MNVTVHLENEMGINSNKQNSGISLLEIIVVGGGGCGGDGDGCGCVKVLLLQ